MQGNTANRLAQYSDKIMKEWASRAVRQVGAANKVDALTLANSLPLFLEHLGLALATNKKLDFRSVARHDAESVRIGKMHGAVRAGTSAYSLTAVIYEYHLLREVIFEVLEVEERLSQLERDIILDSMEQAVNDAAVEFTEAHAEIQEKFISTLTHDLRNPLSAAKMGAEWILKNAQDPVICLNTAQRILTSTVRVDTMIQDLLDASKVRAGDALSFDFSHCHLDKLLGDVIDEMNFIYGERFNFEFEKNVEGHFGCDGIRRAVENLIGNAVKYSTPATPITLSLKKLGSKLLITVHNIGNPIGTQDLSYIFDHYRRSKSAEAQERHGWGLGLTLVQGVVTAHQGSVKVESSHARGTLFTMELPLS